MSDFEYYKQKIERHIERKRREREAPKTPRPREQPPTTNNQSAGRSFFLGDEFGKKIHQKVIDKYGQFPAISCVVYDEDGKVAKGSTPFYVSAVNEFLPEGIRTASQADLERILKNDELKLEGQWEDTSLVLRSAQDPNKYLAQDLYKQFSSRGISLNEGIPIVIPLFGTRLRTDDNSPYKLTFDLIDSPVYFEAPILNEPSLRKFDSSDIDESTGLPKTVKDKGQRTLYTRNFDGYNLKNSGLSGLLLNGHLVVESNSEYFQYSSSDGRVVLVAAEGSVL